MDYTVDDVREELKNMRARVHHGELFDSLGTEVGRLIDQFDYDAPTVVEQLDPVTATAIHEKVSDWQNALIAGQPVVVTDQELLDVMSGLRQTDPELRDKGVFFFISDALQANVFTDAQIVMMTRYLLQDSVLFSHIDETDNDGIFFRSFAVFILSMLNYANRNSEVELFSDDLHEMLIDNLATYIALEHDTRGFVEGKGWAHAFLHIANLLDELTHDDAVTRADKLFLLTVLIERIKRLETPLVMGENRRIDSYIVTLVNLNPLYEQYFLKQLKQWRQEMTRRMQPEVEADWHRMYNQQRLLQGLLLREKLPKEIYDYLNEARNFLA